MTGFWRVLSMGVMMTLLSGCLWLDGGHRHHRRHFPLPPLNFQFNQHH